MGDLFGLKTASWGSDNGEQRKVITSVLMESGHPVTVFAGARPRPAPSRPAGPGR
ncbi:hypothetical protein [Streptomyces sp. NPDC002044]|uniref:hypothetical protein n=1 Tax=Streptomyces sp. NPDC002044 TaxID=3154662 RepID=UPI00332E3DAF